MSNNIDKKSIQLLAPILFSLGNDDINNIDNQSDDKQPEKNKLPTFEIKAYSGDVVNQWYGSVIVDLAGVSVTEKSRPILLEHNRSIRVGHSTEINIGEYEMNVSGVISGTAKEVKDVVNDGINGFPWQASINVIVKEYESIKAGEQTIINGREIVGPIEVARQSELIEVSFVALGADDDTSATIAASKVAKQTGGTDMSDKTKTVDASDDQIKLDAPKQQVVEPVINPAVDELQLKREAYAQEVERVGKLEEVCGGNKKVLAMAIREQWSTDRAELELFRANAPTNQTVVNGSATPEMSNDIIEAALVLSTGADQTGEDEKKLQMAEDRYGSGGISLQQLLLECANKSGYRKHNFQKGDLRNILKFAFSTRDISKILDSDMNKKIARSFNSVESSWRDIASIRSVNDFKTNSDVALIGDSEFEELAADGQIQHGVLDEHSYSYSIDTYAKMKAITRQDIINDNLGILSQIGEQIGRGGMLAVNKKFWTVFMGNSAFFTTARSNYIANYPLSIDNLTTLETLFNNQTDPDGDPLGVDPKILLVPNALYRTALAIMESSAVVSGNTTKGPAANTFQGNFKVVKSSYLSNANYTGYSSTAHYLLADPSDMPTVIQAFLLGKQTPTVDQSDADFDRLGIQIRGYLDFGTALAEYRAGVKSNGAAE